MSSSSSSAQPLARVQSLDHVVLTCSDVQATIAWYERYLGMRSSSFASAAEPPVTRYALHFGDQKLNLHQRGREFEPKAATALPGTADVCFIVDDETKLADVIRGFRADGIEVLEGGVVVPRTGARGKLNSIYVRDPDGNLIELSQYVEITE